TGEIQSLLDGVVLEARIVGQCGYFLLEGVEPDESIRTLEGRSVQGRFDVTDEAMPAETRSDGLYDNLKVSITNDGDCGATGILRVEIDASYPGPIGSSTGDGLFVGTEWVEFEFS